MFFELGVPVLEADVKEGISAAILVKWICSLMNQESKNRWVSDYVVIKENGLSLFVFRLQICSCSNENAQRVNDQFCRYDLLDLGKKMMDRVGLSLSVFVWIRATFA